MVGRIIGDTASQCERDMPTQFPILEFSGMVDMLPNMVSCQLNKFVSWT